MSQDKKRCMFVSAEDDETTFNSNLARGTTTLFFKRDGAGRSSTTSSVNTIEIIDVDATVPPFRPMRDVGASSSTTPSVDTEIIDVDTIEIIDDDARVPAFRPIRDVASSSTTPSVDTEILKDGVRLPPFQPYEPEIWFAKVEGQFSITGVVSDVMKFNYVIGQLDDQFLTEVMDLIINPPATDKYAKLKTELLKQLSLSKEEKFKQLLMHEKQGNRKPSEFLCHLRGLVGPQGSDDFLRTIWTSRLPRSIQSVLDDQPIGSLEVLAEMADRIHDISPPSTQVNTASSSTSSSSIQGAVKEVAELQRQLQNPSKGRSTNLHVCLPNKRDGVSPAEAAASLPTSPGAGTLAKKKGAGPTDVRERAAAVRTRRLMKELNEIQRLQNSRPDPVFSVELVGDNLFEWHVRLHQIDPESELAADLRELHISHILLHLVFPENFPFAPPFMRVIEPRIEKGFVMEGGAICMELLTPRGWASAYTVEAVVMQFAASVVKGQGRVVRAPTRPSREFSRRRAEEAFRSLVKTHDKYGWVTPALSDG